MFLKTTWGKMMVILNMCFSKNLKMEEMPEAETCHLVCFVLFLLYFQVSQFSFHYADAPLEVTVKFCIHTLCVTCLTSNFYTENPTGFE